ncbi:MULTISPECIES: cysteine hydrolase family protein [Acetobacterium]|jgi:nicotinamidase-related amidase|uniref:Isochorismatase family protein n=1 Tax=Acetobacterium wieringae TaxID=52694 RepID=A0A1F2PLN1_9FIRM|nr:MULTISPECIES: isochorismatase family cysteine hydrolase [Acetobacterium]OFV72329.1 isochorismatase family protein [Acetobacterium wieringae]HAZ05706.1 cysteine hydrolase [Acetobacterium sp.]
MKSILLVIDYQHDFVDGALGFPQAVLLEEPIAQKIMAYRQKGQEILFTYDTHTADYLNTQEGRNLPVVHCIKGTPGWELYGKVAKLRWDTDTCIEKIAFGSLELAEFLAANHYDQVELVGVVSNICLISDAVLAKAALPEAEIIVDASCVASNDDCLNAAALDVMASMQICIINRRANG